MGNDAEFARLYETSREKLLMVAFFAIEDMGIAQDIVQDCFMRLWERWDAFTDRQNALPYMFASVRNACVDHWRKEWHRTEAIRSQVLEAKSTYQPDLTNGYQFKAIYKAIESLPSKSRQVLVLFYFGEKSYAEIASMMNVSIHTVRNQKARALRLIKKAIKPIK